MIAVSTAASALLLAAGVSYFQSTDRRLADMIGGGERRGEDPWPRLLLDCFQPLHELRVSLDLLRGPRITISASP